MVTLCFHLEGPLVTQRAKYSTLPGRHRRLAHIRLPAIRTTISSKCQRLLGRGRQRRSRRASSPRAHGLRIFAIKRNPNRWRMEFHGMALRLVQFLAIMLNGARARAERGTSRCTAE